MSDKVDKGFALNYWRLNYRRKFIRTLWMIPFCICAIMLFWIRFPTLSAILWTAILVLVEILQLVYTYNKWKSEQQLEQKNIME